METTMIWIELHSHSPIEFGNVEFDGLGRARGETPPVCRVDLRARGHHVTQVIVAVIVLPVVVTA